MKLLPSLLAIAGSLSALAPAAFADSSVADQSADQVVRRHHHAKLVQHQQHARAALPEARHGLTAGRPIRGVNLGHFLITESWMDPAFYLDAQPDGNLIGDERRWVLAHSNRSEAYAKLNAHYSSYLQEADFSLMQSYGINAVRIPIPYWTFEDAPPANSQEVYNFKGGRSQIARVLLWCKKYSIDVTLDLHALPGSQNAYDNSGSRSGVFWQTRQSYYDRSIKALTTMVDWYVNNATYGGVVKSIIPVNEPLVRDGAIPLALIQKFYVDSYKAIRGRVNATRGAQNIPTIYFSNSIIGYDPWYSWIQGNYDNGTFIKGTIGMDVHKYQAFPPLDKLTRDQQVDRACKEGPRLTKLQALLPVMIGELSDGVALRCTDYRTCKGKTIQDDVNTLNTKSGNYFARRFWEAQRVTYETYASGWYFWSWKTVSASQWSYRDSVRQLWLPSNPNERVYWPNQTEIAQGLCVSRKPNRGIIFRTTSPS